MYTCIKQVLILYSTSLLTYSHLTSMVLGTRSHLAPSILMPTALSPLCLWLASSEFPLGASVHPANQMSTHLANDLLRCTNCTWSASLRAQHVL